MRPGEQHFDTGRGSSLDAISCAALIEQRGEEGSDEPVYWHVPLEGEPQGWTWPQLSRWSAHVAAELAVAAFAAWRLGATPVPVRWDLPEWELERVHEVIDSPVNLGPDDLGWINELERRDGVPPTPTAAVSPSLHGICSSGSTGTPKVI